MKQGKKVELLAPAGNKEAFYGAIHAGADAVYLGGSRFGARAYADNFTEDDLIACIRYAHIWGRKVYLTVNTLVKESEFAELYQYLLPYYEAGLDGVIIQDIGVFAYIRKHFPGLELHGSTQMTLTGEYGAAMLKEMGACRIVPARELSLEEIVRIKKRTGLEIETFVHGAMCYCYSGQCLFSSILGGRSGNRGRCAQPCRLPYSVKTGKGAVKECYPLSLKDMCTIEMIPALIEAGIDSFKIEGRMKKPEYAAGVTAIYRKYIDLYYANPNKAFAVSRKDLDKLSKLYIRSERQTGYYDKHNGREMIAIDNPAYSGSDEALLAKIRQDYLESKPRIPISVSGYFQVGEPAIVTLFAEDTSVTVEGEIVQPASKSPISYENIEKQLKKLGDTCFACENIEITLGENAFYPLKAINDLRRWALEQLENALIDKNKLVACRRSVPVVDGEMETAAENSEMSAMNSGVNRETAAKNICVDINADINADRKADRSAGSMHVAVRTLEQLRVVTDNGKRDTISRIYVDADLLMKQPEDVWNAVRDFSGEMIVAMPYIIRQADAPFMKKLFDYVTAYPERIAGFLVRSLEGMGYLKNRNYKGKIYTDAGFYIWNRESVSEWSDSVQGFCIPLELKAAEQHALTDMEQSFEKIFYGRIPMMLTANCVARTTQGCKLGTKEESSVTEITDRYRKRFPVYLNCTHCMNIIYNSVPLSLHGDWNKWKNSVDMRLDFTLEDADTTQRVLAFFEEIVHMQGFSKNMQIPYAEYTTGHEKRGVE